MKLPTIILVVFAVTCSTMAEAQPSTRLTVLVDLSRSFAPLRDEDTSALRAIGEAIPALIQNEDWPQSAVVVFATIVDSALNTTMPCRSIEYKPTLVGVGKSGIRRPKELTKAIGECVDRLVGMSQTPSQWTDISGAISMASRWGKDEPGRKWLVVLSDFDESIPSNFKPLALKLSGEDCLLLYRPNANALREPGPYLEGITRWKDHLKEAGAGKVSDMAIAGATAALLQQQLR